jgi:3-methyladenine DNA glycosylase/8-oxoguanine DNA glycosylase
VPVIPAPLTQATLELAVVELAARDSDLAAIVERFGPPPLWDRPAGFPTLVHMILEQQVSLASAQAAFDRLGAAADPLTPDRFLGLWRPSAASWQSSVRGSRGGGRPLIRADDRAVSPPVTR